MLTELRVENLGIVAELTMPIGRGMTAITGETGAGKTLLVEALQLLLGGRADGSLVREGAGEARVDGRFEVTPDGGGDLEELVLTRVVPRDGRSRAYINGRPATAGELAAAGGALVDLHGQQEHQSLLVPAAQRNLLDVWCGTEALTARQEVRVARAGLARLDDELRGLGGDERARAREIDLLRFQLDEIERAGLSDEQEDDQLAAEEALLGDAENHREALTTARTVLDSVANEAIGTAAGSISGRAPFHELHERIRVAQADIAALVSDLRLAADAVIADPERLAVVRERRQRIRELRRKYGATLAEVIAYGKATTARLAELDSHDARAATIERERARLCAHRSQLAADLSRLRRAGAPALSRAVTDRLRALALPSASFLVRIESIELGDDGADAVIFDLAPNPGEPSRPLARAASGGELSRTMLAIRVVLGERGEHAPPTLVFDEVDAGVGGEAGIAVGAALAQLAQRHQVLCVTHLAQVAAQAGAQIHVRKETIEGRTIAEAELLLDDSRVVELSRMLGGIGDSDHARSHALELLAGDQSGRRKRAPA